MCAASPLALLPSLQRPAGTADSILAVDQSEESTGVTWPGKANGEEQSRPVLPEPAAGQEL